MAHVIRSSFVLCPPSIVRMRCAFHAEKFGGLVGQNFMENYDYLCKVIGGGLFSRYIVQRVRTGCLPSNTKLSESKVNFPYVLPRSAGEFVYTAVRGRRIAAPGFGKGIRCHRRR